MRDPSKITTALGRRDTFPRSDSIKITFDPRHDHLTAYTFDSNPNGVQGDMTWFDDTRSSTDYDAVWEVRTEITTEGWTAEFRIPFSQLRFSVTPGEAGRLGLQRPPRHRLQRGDDSLGRDAARRAGIRLALRPPHVREAAGAAAPARGAAVHAGARRNTSRRRIRPRLVGRPRLPHGARHRDHAVGVDQPGLRPGRAGSRGAEPERVRDVLSRRSGRSSSKTAASLVPNFRADADVSLAAHRPAAEPHSPCRRRDGDRAAGCDDDPRRDQGDRQGQRLDLRRPDGADRSRIRAGGDRRRPSAPSG